MRAAQQVAPPLVALGAILAVWEALVRVLVVPAYLLPPPSAIGLAAVHNAHALVAAAGVTALSALLGFSLSTLFGVLAGITLASSRLLERAFYPYTVFLQTVTGVR